MIRSLLTAVAIGAIVSPAASADIREDFTVAITLDAQQIKTEAGTQDLLNSITEQAREACTFTTSGSRIQKIDQVCVSGVVEGTLAKLNTKREQAGQTPFNFARLISNNQSSFQ